VRFGSLLGCTLEMLTAACSRSATVRNRGQYSITHRFYENAASDLINPLIDCGYHENVIHERHCTDERENTGLRQVLLGRLES
jgi:hypothetical protein